MEKNIKKIQQTLISACGDIAEMMDPLLQKHGMTAFNYYKKYFNGHIIRLSTHQKWTENFFQKDYVKLLSVPNSYLVNPLNYYIWQIQDCPELLLDAAVNFDQSNGITIAIKQPDAIEFFGFCTTVKNTSIINNFYLNNLNVLNNYCAYFKDKANKIITDCDSKEIYLLDPKSPNQENNAYTSFTNRQYDCACLLLKGLNSREIAKALNISFRTVETHLATLKKKLVCRNTIELVVKLIEIMKQPYNLSIYTDIF